MVYKKDLELQIKWSALMQQLGTLVGKRPKDLNGVLFLIGAQELGKGPSIFSKEEKQDLMHLGVCKVLSPLGYYELQGRDQDGWPHWRLAKSLPKFDLLDQEKLLKMQVIEYFNKEIGIKV